MAICCATWVEQLDLVLCERVFAEPADIQRAQHAIVRLERNAAERLHAFGEQVLRDLRLGRQVDQVLLAEHGGRPRRECDAARRLHARVGPALFDEALVLRYLQHVAPVLTGVGLVQHAGCSRRAGSPVCSDALTDANTSSMSRCETTALFTSSSSRNRSRSRASARCIGTGAFFVQDVVDGDRDLLGHFLHEGDLVILVFALLQAAESHRAQTAQRRRQRHRAERLHAVFAQPRR